jgi:Xaa-Pro aminopeptidase
MSSRGLDAFVSFTPENIYYLTAHDSPGYYFYQASVVTHSQPPVNVLRRIETTNTLGRGWSRRAVGYEDRQDPIEATCGLLEELGVASRTVGAEGDAWFVSPKRYEQLGQAITHAGGKLVDASGVIEGLRVIKSTEELAHIRTAARAVERAMRVAIDVSRTGTNENDVAGETVRELIRAGSEYAGLPPFITSGPRTSLCHSTWAGRTYEAGDVLNYELPGVVNRYCAALFRCGTLGRPDGEFQRRAAMVQESLGRDRGDQARRQLARGSRGEQGDLPEAWLRRSTGTPHGILDRHQLCSGLGRRTYHVHLGRGRAAAPARHDLPPSPRLP